MEFITEKMVARNMTIMSKKMITRMVTVTKFDAVSTRSTQSESLKILTSPRIWRSRNIASRVFPHRSCFTVCLKARGREDTRRKVVDKGDKPTVLIDYKAFGENEDDDDKIAMIVNVEHTGRVGSCWQRCRRQEGCRQDLSRHQALGSLSSRAGGEPAFGPSAGGD